MNIISIGFGCQVSHNIEKFFGPKETNFFDWIITDFKSVLHILKNINNEDLLIKSKFTNKDVFKNHDDYIDHHFHKIECIEFKMISYHDLPINIDFIDSMDDFIEKYNRRLIRFKKFINSDENLHMVHCLDHMCTEPYIVTKEDIFNFKKYLFEINPNNKCFLHILIPPKYNIALNDLVEENVYVYNLKDMQYENVLVDWKNENFNWNKVFDNIKTIN